MKVWRVRISYDECFENVIKDYLVQYHDRYTAKVVEHDERINFLSTMGEDVDSVYFSVTSVSREQNEGEDGFITFPDEDGNNYAFNAPLNEEW